MECGTENCGETPTPIRDTRMTANFARRSAACDRVPPGCGQAMNQSVHGFSNKLVYLTTRATHEIQNSSPVDGFPEHLHS